MRVFFVCTGNICRSPMAEEYMKHRAARTGLSHLVVASGGLLGIVGEPASPPAVHVLREDAGLDLSSHRSKGVTEVDVVTAELLIVMTLQHREELEQRFPEAHGKTVLLRCFEKDSDPDPRGAPDLDDPIGAPLETYRGCFRTIRRCVDHLALHLKHVS